jgi:tRNA dimethylallyltransferase
MNKPKLIVVLGPTASGKSDVAVQIAKKFNGEIISADSRQVYRGMDIGTGKITKDEMQGIPHYLLDVSSPKKVFSVSEYRKFANKIIQKILSENKLPIICGGTGFYIDAAVSNAVFPEVPPNKKLRKELELKSLEELQKMIIELDPERAKRIEMKNKVRLVRAIEIATALGSVPQVKKSDPYDTLYIGINWPKEKLHERIQTRLISRLKAGMIKEVENLYNDGVSWKRMHALGLEYRYVSLFLRGKLTEEEMIEKLSLEIRHYAKRQMTWFKRNKKIVWLEPEKLGEVDEIVRLFLKK